MTKYHNREQLERVAERHRKEAERLERRIAMLEALPPEPVVEDGEPNVIWFDKLFSSNQSASYTYAAVRASDGLWYTTGPASPKGFAWSDLIQWILDGNEDGEVWHATGYDLL